MSASTDYSNIDRPYGSSLIRKSDGDIPMEASSSIPDNGSVEQKVVKSDGGMDDVWVRNFIRSINWKPKISGFNIDGRTGDAQFSNIFLNQFSLLSRRGVTSSLDSTLSLIASPAVTGGRNFLFIGRDGQYVAAQRINYIEIAAKADETLAAVGGNLSNGTAGLSVDQGTSIGLFNIWATAARNVSGVSSDNGVYIGINSEGEHGSIVIGYIPTGGTAVTPVIFINNDDNHAYIQDGSAFELGYFTTAERDAFANPTAGDLIYNTDTNKMQVYEGSSWKTVTTS